MSIIQRLIRQFFPPKQDPSVAILGVDSAGKTTLLYLLKLGEVVTTIPTLGINYESFTVPTADGTISNKKLDGWDIGLGCGRNMPGMVIMYGKYSHGLIWMVDSSDRERFQESVDDLTKTWLSCEYERHSEGNLTPQPVLILANKQDKPGCIPVDEIRVRFAKAISAMPPPYRGGRLYSVFKSSLLEPIPKSGLPEAFEWLLFALNALKKGSSSVPIANLNPAEVKPKELAAAGPGDSPTQYQKLDSWLTRIYTEQSSPEEFIAQFHAINLPAWDHYTHIRIAHLLLTTYGRQRGKDMIFDGLAKYISQSPQARGRTFHFTMTYFWIQIVHFGIRSMAHLTPTSITTAATEAITSSLNDDFARFLLMNPHVVDGNLWAEYYTKEAIMTPTAKEEMVLPDKKPLPNLVIRDALGGLS